MQILMSYFNIFQVVHKWLDCFIESCGLTLSMLNAKGATTLFKTKIFSGTILRFLSKCSYLSFFAVIFMNLLQWFKQNKFLHNIGSLHLLGCQVFLPVFICYRRNACTDLLRAVAPLQVCNHTKNDSEILFLKLFFDIVKHIIQTYPIYN